MVKEEQKKLSRQQVSLQKQRAIVIKALQTIIKNASKPKNQGAFLINENVESIFYEPFKKQFADYVRFLDPKYKKLSDEEAITKLNDYILLSITETVMSILRTKMEKEGLVPKSDSSVIKSIEKDYSFDKAKSVYYDACKFVEVSLAKEHKVEKFSDLVNSDGDWDYRIFREWKRWTGGCFATLENVLDQCEKYKSIKPLKKFTQGRSLGDKIRHHPIGCFCGDLLDPAVYMGLSFMGLVAVFVAFIGSVLYVELIEPMIRDPNINKWADLASMWGIDEATIKEILQERVKEFSQEDFDNLRNLALLESQNDIAVVNGYTDYNEACADILAHTTIESQTKIDALINLGIERAAINANFAQNQGFASYAEVLDYLEQHKILLGETEHKGYGGAGWSVYQYDLVDAKAIANQLSAIDEHYANLKVQIQSGTFDFTVQKYDDIKYQELANAFEANESYHNIVFDRFSTSNIFSEDTIAQELYLNVEDKFEDRTTELVGIPQGSLGHVVGSKVASINSAGETIADTLGMNFGLDDLALALGGTVGAATLGMAIKTAPYLTKLLKARKINQRQQIIDEMAKYNDSDLCFER